MSSSPLQSLFRERSMKMGQKQLEKQMEKSFAEKVRDEFELVYARKKFTDKALVECNHLCKQPTVPIAHIQQYTYYLYNATEFMSFESYYETYIKSKEEKIREMFEKIRFDISDSYRRRLLFLELDKILEVMKKETKDVEIISLKSVKEYVDSIHQIGDFIPYFTLSSSSSSSSSSLPPRMRERKWFIRFYKDSMVDDDKKSDDDDILHGPFDSEDDASFFLLENYFGEEMDYRESQGVPSIISKFV